MLYLDNAATGGYKPDNVQKAVSASLKQCANPGRSGHKLSLALSERVFACRSLLADFFDAESFERVIFTKNCTEALNLALLGTLKRGDHVVTTCIEHNSVLRPLHHLQQAGVITYSVAPLTEGRLKAQTVASLVQPNTAVVCVTSASNVTGESPDLYAVKKLLPPRVLLFVDGAQGAGHIPLSMQKMGIDALALAGHKGLFAIQGAGALLLSERVNPRPLLFGGTGSDSLSLNMPDFYPDRLESGTLSYPAICSLAEGILHLKAHFQEYSHALFRLTAALHASLLSFPNVQTYFSPNACGIACFRHLTLPSEEVAQRLSDEFSIAVRGGLHCAPLAHAALGTQEEGLVRISFAPNQTLSDVDALLSALKKIS